MYWCRWRCRFSILFLGLFLLIFLILLLLLILESPVVGSHTYKMKRRRTEASEKMDGSGASYVSFGFFFTNAPSVKRWFRALCDFWLFFGCLNNLFDQRTVV